MSKEYGWLPSEIDDMDFEMFLDYLLIDRLVEATGVSGTPAKTTKFSLAHAAQYGFKVVKKCK